MAVRQIGQPGPGVRQIPQTTPKPSGNVLTNFIKGVGKGAVQSVTDSANLGEDIGRALTPKFAEGFLFGEDKGSVSSRLLGDQRLEKLTKTQGTAQKVGKATEFVAELFIPGSKVSGGAGTKFVNAARRLYQSALKPKGNLTEKARLVETGLKEGIGLTQRGVVKTGELIDNLEGQLDVAIEQATRLGKKVDVSKFQPYIDEVKNLFRKSVDVEGAGKDIAEIEGLWKGFKAKYGNLIDPNLAQELKVNTYKVLRKKYGQLSSAAVEGQKTIARGLKEGVLDVTEGVSGDVNKRLGDLYEFQRALDKASGRLGNLDIFGLGTKILASGGAGITDALAIANQLLGPAGKALGARALYRFGSVLKKLDPSDIKYIGQIFNNALVQGAGPIKTIQGAKKFLSGNE